MARMKTGGRVKGSPNKLTCHTREALRQVLAQELDKLPEMLDSLPPAQRIDVVFKLLKFILPSIEAISGAEIDKISLSTKTYEASLNAEINMQNLF